MERMNRDQLFTASSSTGTVGSQVTLTGEQQTNKRRWIFTQHVSKLQC